MSVKETNYKQAIVVRSDLELSIGKTCSQVAHASISSADLANKRMLKYWKNEGQKKIVLKVRNVEDLLELEKRCNKLKIPCSIIRDAGMTELPKGTITCLGIGPGKEEKINKVTGNLPLLK